MKSIRILFLLFIPFNSYSQLHWSQVDSLFGPLPASVHIYRSTDTLNGKPNIAYYVEADLKDKTLQFNADTTLGRRLTPQGFYEKNKQPIIVVNTTFFSFATNQNLSVVVKDGRLVGYNIHSLPGRGKDTLTWRHPVGSAIGISRKRKADIAWLVTDSSKKFAYAFQGPYNLIRDSVTHAGYEYFRTHLHNPDNLKNKWKMQTAVGGGPVLVQNGQVSIANNEEWKFPGKAIDDKHPRTAMGYTRDNKLIILVIEGRHPGIAEGASLVQEAIILKDLGCEEAINLDGGGSSCMLVNGKQTIQPSDKGIQRPVPAVFLISKD